MNRNSILVFQLIIGIGFIAAGLDYGSEWAGVLLSAAGGVSIALYHIAIHRAIRDA